MTLTFRVLVLVLISLVVGSLGWTVQAQPDGTPFQAGQRVTLHYGERSVDCTVQDIRGGFLRCVKPPDPFSRFPRYVEWYNLATMDVISVREQ